MEGKWLREDKGSEEEKEVIVSVILPTYNESGNIAALIGRIDKALAAYPKEIIVVDDDSPDKTWKVAGESGNKDVIVIRRTENRGLVNSLKRGVSESKGRYVIWMDADQSMPPEIIPKLVDELKTNDIAVASRYVKGGKDFRPMLRLVTSRMINLAANLILNFKVLDYTSGFVAVRREVFDQVSLSNSVYGEYCIAFLYQAGRKKYTIKEVPYSFIDRLEGKSKTAGNLSSLLKFGWVYFKRIITLRLYGK